MVNDIEIHIAHTPSDSATDLIIDNLWRHNEQYAEVNMLSFLVSATRNGETIGGLVARTWWGVLDIQYLWIMADYRGQGIGKDLMLLAEEEGRKNSCRMATVDTFSCQAPEFYHKLGYSDYGSLAGYAEKYTRHYMSKTL